MLLELTQSIAGARYSLAPGDIVEVGASGISPEEAKNLLKKGYAVEYHGESDEEQPKQKGKK